MLGNHAIEDERCCATRKQSDRQTDLTWSQLGILIPKHMASGVYAGNKHVVTTKSGQRTKR